MPIIPPIAVTSTAGMWNTVVNVLYNDIVLKAKVNTKPIAYIIHHIAAIVASSGDDAADPL